MSDFFGSLVKKRLFEQLRRLRDSYPVALMILEGDLHEVSDFKSPQAILGAFVAIEVDERVPILTTADRDQTAALHLWPKNDAQVWVNGRLVFAGFGESQKSSIIQIPVTQSEYFLMENREQDLNHNGVFDFDDANGDGSFDFYTDSYQGS